MINKFCGECGSKLPENAKFCGECGRPVVQAGKEQQVAQEKNTESSNINSTPPGQEEAAATVKQNFNVQAVISWAAVWFIIWVSLYPIRLFPYFDFISSNRLLSYLLACLTGGIIAGLSLQFLNITRNKPTLKLFKRPLVFWMVCLVLLTCLKVLVNYLGLFLFGFFALLPVAATLFGAWLIWELLPSLVQNENQSNDLRLKAALCWGLVGVLVIFLERLFLSFFIIY